MGDAADYLTDTHDDPDQSKWLAHHLCECEYGCVYCAEEEEDGEEERREKTLPGETY